MQVSDTSRFASSICTICYKKACWWEWALSMVWVEEGREFRFRGNLYSQESTFPLVRYALCAWDGFLTQVQKRIMLFFFVSECFDIDSIVDDTDIGNF